jgi:large subunit ribosomal protein L25
MIKIKADKRETKEREENTLLGVLYGPKIKNVSLKLDLKDFEKTYKEAGESSLLSLDVDGKEYLVLIHDVKNDPLTMRPIHVDFYQPILTEEVEASVPLIFEGESLAVKDLGGTLIKEIQEIEVKALPQKLPHEIRVDISVLKTFEDEILVKDLKLPEDVKVEKDPEDMVALVSPPQKEEELELPSEEEAEKVEKVEGGEKEEDKEDKNE